MKYKDKILKRIIEHAKANYKRIDKKDMELGNLVYNYMCHMNAVQYIKTGQAEEVYLCIYIDNNYPVVHFINKKEGKFIDNTLGWRYEQLEYYIIKKVSEDEYNNTYNRYYAKQIADVLRKFAEKPQNIDNFENYLENCFTGWKEKFANTPEKMIEDMKHFAEMEV